MRQQIQMAEVEIVADLGTAAISLRDIVNMKVGDVIPLDIPKTVEAKVDGVPVMECAYGKFNGQYTLRVEKLLSNSLESNRKKETKMSENATQTIAEEDWACHGGRTDRTRDQSRAPEIFKELSGKHTLQRRWPTISTSFSIFRSS